MAKVKNPVFSLRATGRLGQVVRYSRSRGMDRATAKKTGGAVQGIRQRRQASIIAEAGRLWTTRDGAGPEPTYQAYVSAISKENYYFMFGDLLLEWSITQIMVAE